MDKARKLTEAKSDHELVDQQDEKNDDEKM